MRLYGYITTSGDIYLALAQGISTEFWDMSAGILWIVGGGIMTWIGGRNEALAKRIGGMAGFIGTLAFIMNGIVIGDSLPRFFLPLIWLVGNGLLALKPIPFLTSKGVSWPQFFRDKDRLAFGICTLTNMVLMVDRIIQQDWIELVAVMFWLTANFYKLGQEAKDLRLL